MVIFKIKLMVLQNYTLYDILKLSLNNFKPSQNFIS